jgi:hypothetical protein
VIDAIALTSNLNKPDHLFWLIPTNDDVRHSPDLMASRPEVAAESRMKAVV